MTRNSKSKAMFNASECDDNTECSMVYVFKTYSAAHLQVSVFFVHLGQSEVLLPTRVTLSSKEKEVCHGNIS